MSLWKHLSVVGVHGKQDNSRTVLEIQDKMHLKIYLNLTFREGNVLKTAMILKEFFWLNIDSLLLKKNYNINLKSNSFVQGHYSFMDSKIPIITVKSINSVPAMSVL